ncbi:MAG: hypothetical protein NTY38_12880 [Acidobacteria bacterium]|nr:hypothetical protein [Acidobacteriota bacterium]
MRAVLFALLAPLCLPAQPVAVLEGCPSPDPRFYEDNHYQLARDAGIGGGFASLRSYRTLLGSDAALLPRKGPFRYKPAQDLVGKLQSRLSAASRDDRFHLGIVTLSIDSCDPAKRELVLNYHVFATNLALPAFQLFESRELEARNPVEAAGASARKQAVQLQPALGYNAADKLYAGSAIRWQGEGGLFDTARAEGLVSSRGSHANLELAGGREWASGFVREAHWQLGYLREDRPAGEINLAGANLYFQAFANSRPLGKFDTVLRFGSAMAGGNQQSGLEQAALPANTLRNSRDGAWKAFAGITSRVGANSLAISYGVQLGNTGQNRLLDYHKHLLDAAYSTYKVVADHRLLEYETRFTAGALKVPGLAPVGERFFGGNRETDFLAGSALASDWRIRANPLIRGIPANGLNRVIAGPVTGGEGFLAWNNTVAFTAYGKPLIPKELTADAAFQDQLDRQKSANRSALIVAYRTEDAAYQQAVKLIPEVDAALVRLGDLVKTVGGAPAVACLRTIRDRRATLEEAAEAMEIVVSDEDEAVIGPVLACAARVTAAHPDPLLEEPLASLRALRGKIAMELEQVDGPKAEARAAADLRLANRILDVFLREASLVSLSPVAVFDVARLAGPARGPGWLGPRYALGGGVRLGFVRILNLTAGYAVNVRRQAGEKPGAFFFSLDFLDLFR